MLANEKLVAFAATTNAGRARQLTAPRGARFAWFKDPDGNLLSLAAYPRAGGSAPAS